MPNHVTNIIRASPEVLAAFLDRGQDGDEPAVDFGKIIPIPEDDDPRITATKTEYGHGMVGWSFDGLSPMDFARELWGTKWNAYSVRTDDREDMVQFQTAWRHPLPVITALSKKFPYERVEVRYADEDLGQNVGHYVMVDGVFREVYVGNESDEDTRNEFAAQTLYDMTYAEVEAQWNEENE